MRHAGRPARPGRGPAKPRDRSTAVDGPHAARAGWPALLRPSALPFGRRRSPDRPGRRRTRRASARLFGRHVGVASVRGRRPAGRPERDHDAHAPPVWVVVLNGSAYVRSYLGMRGAWYRRVRVGRRAEITVDGQTVAVGLEPVADEALDRRISAAYRAKYGSRWPAPTEAMVGAEA